MNFHRYVKYQSLHNVTKDRNSDLSSLSVFSAFDISENWF